MPQTPQTPQALSAPSTEADSDRWQENGQVVAYTQLLQAYMSLPEIQAYEAFQMKVARVAFVRVICPASIKALSLKSISKLQKH